MLPLGRPWSPPKRSGLVRRVLPRWLAWIGLLVGLIALINETMLGSEAAWGFLTGIIWMFTGGIVLALRGTQHIGGAPAGHHRQLTPPQPQPATELLSDWLTRPHRPTSP